MSGMPRPDDETKSFQARWNTLVRVLLVESSVKLVARTAMDFADWDNGEGVFIGNLRMAVATTQSDKTVRTAWATLRALGMAHRVERGSSTKIKSDRYNLAIPPQWQAYAITGPHEQKFVCLHCQKKFLPPPVCVLTGNDRAAWRLSEACFCPPPRKRKGHPTPIACITAWEREERTRWSDLDDEDAWKLFRQARSDDW